MEPIFTRALKLVYKVIQGVGFHTRGWGSILEDNILDSSNTNIHYYFIIVSITPLQILNSLTHPLLNHNTW